MRIAFTSSLISALALASAGAEEHVVRTGVGQATVYLVAENEIHNLTRDRAEAVTGGVAPRLRAQAAGDADTRELVRAYMLEPAQPIRFCDDCFKLGDAMLKGAPLLLVRLECLFGVLACELKLPDVFRLCRGGRIILARAAAN